MTPFLCSFWRMGFGAFAMLTAISGAAACRDKEAKADSAYAECAEQYSNGDCTTFDVERYFMVDAVIECYNFYYCGTADTGSATEENLNACIEMSFSDDVEQRSLGYCPPEEYDVCAVSGCTKDLDCMIVSDLNRALAGEISMSKWCEEASHSPTSCKDEKAQLSCEPPTSG